MDREDDNHMNVGNICPVCGSKQINLEVVNDTSDYNERLMKKECLKCGFNIIGFLDDIERDWNGKLDAGFRKVR